ncbi:MAG: ribonuclease P protein component 4 [Desulfurococcaceae archaeon]
MGVKAGKEKGMLKTIARERVSLLLDMAFRRVREGDIDLARKYVEIALRVASKARLRLPRTLKRSYCRNCFVPLIPGLTLSVRIKSSGKESRVVYRCLLCGWIRRFVVKGSRRRLRRGLLEK